MGRLTKRDNRTKSGCRLPTYATKNEEDVFVKLFQLENLEDSLGIDLITLFKALKDGIYYNPSNEFFKKPTLYYSNYNNCWCFDLALGTYIVRLKDYKKTWWLKGDLEND